MANDNDSFEGIVDEDGQILDPPQFRAPAVGVGAEQPDDDDDSETTPQPQQRSRGGRPRGSRNKPKEPPPPQAAPPPGLPSGAGFGAASRPAGKTGHYPSVADTKLSNDGDVLWMQIIDEIQANGFSPYDMEIRVKRLSPHPAVQLGTIDGASVVGDASTSAGTALRDGVINWFVLPSGVNAPSLYELNFCWKNKAQFFRRGELQLPSRNEIIAMRQAEYARQSASNVGAGYVPQPPPPRPRQAPQMEPHAEPWQPAPWQGGLGAPSPSFDPDLERQKIRQELERENEMQRLRHEIEELRRRPPPQQPMYPPPYGYPSPMVPNGGPRARGAGGYPPAYPPMPPYGQPQSDDDRIASIVVRTLTQMGVAPQPAGVGASPPQNPVVAAGASSVGELEQAVEAAMRFKKQFGRMKTIFSDDDDEERERSHAQHQQEEAEQGAPPKIRFQPTGQRWKDGRDVMLPIDQEGNPVLPTSLPEAMTIGFANPFILEPLAAGLGPALGALASRFAGAASAGVGAAPQIQVQQVQPEQQQYAPPAQPLPQPQQTQLPAPTSDDGGWNLT